MRNTKSDVYKDHTVDKNKRPNTSPPGPPDSGDPDFEPNPHPRSPGFSNTPGAGPNPTPSNNDLP